MSEDFACECFNHPQATHPVTLRDGRRGLAKKSCRMCLATGRLRPPQKEGGDPRRCLLCYRILPAFAEQHRACPKERCPPLEPEERADPEIKLAATALHEPLWQYIDLGIRPLVAICQMRGWGTVFSCDGHGRGDPYIEFWDAEDAAHAIAFLDKSYGPCVVKERRSTLLGPFWRVFFSRERITPSPRQFRLADKPT